jgi:hypothetical protein
MQTTISKRGEQGDSKTDLTVGIQERRPRSSVLNLGCATFSEKSCEVVFNEVIFNAATA